MFFLLARQIRGDYEPIKQVASSSTFPFGVIPQRSEDSYTKVAQETYIQNNSPVIPHPFEGFGFVSRLLAPTTEIIYLPGDDNPRGAGQCVEYVKYVLGYKAANFGGDAIVWKAYVNAKEPSLYSVVVINVGKWGHLGIVIDYDSATITVRSRNWRNLWEISDDKFDINDARIAGYINY